MRNTFRFLFIAALVLAACKPSKDDQEATALPVVDSIPDTASKPMPMALGIRRGVWVSENYLRALKRTLSPEKALEAARSDAIITFEYFKDSILGYPNLHEGVFFGKLHMVGDSFKLSRSDGEPTMFDGYTMLRLDSNHVRASGYGSSNVLRFFSSNPPATPGGDDIQNPISLVFADVLFPKPLADSATGQLVDFGRNGSLSGFSGFDRYYILDDYAMRSFCYESSPEYDLIFLYKPAPVDKYQSDLVLAFIRRPRSVEFYNVLPDDSCDMEGQYKLGPLFRTLRFAQ